MTSIFYNSNTILQISSILLWILAIIRGIQRLKTDVTSMRRWLTIIFFCLCLVLSFLISVGWIISAIVALIFYFFVNRLYIGRRLANAVEDLSYNCSVKPKPLPYISHDDKQQALATYNEAGNPIVILTKDLCRLPLEEFYFLVAHEVAHHALDHFTQKASGNFKRNVLAGLGALIGGFLGESRVLYFMGLQQVSVLKQDTTAT
jgi:Zn-dependent protease with chaperone function